MNMRQSSFFYLKTNCNYRNTLKSLVRFFGKHFERANYFFPLGLNVKTDFGNLTLKERLIEKYSRSEHKMHVNVFNQIIKNFSHINWIQRKPEEV